MKIKVGDTVYMGRESTVPFTVTALDGQYLIQVKDGDYSPSWIDIALVRTKK